MIVESVESFWLVEYVEAKPCPIYVTDGSCYTCDAWEAKRFDTREDAETWMKRPNVVAFEYPWKAVSHGFVTTNGMVE